MNNSIFHRIVKAGLLLAVPIAIFYLLTTMIGIFWFEFEWGLMSITAIFRIIFLAGFLATFGRGFLENTSTRRRKTIRIFVTAFVVNEIFLLYSRVLNNSSFSSNEESFWSLIEISYSALGLFVPFVLFLTTIVSSNHKD